MVDILLTICLLICNLYLLLGDHQRNSRLSSIGIMLLMLMFSEILTLVVIRDNASHADVLCDSNMQLVLYHVLFILCWIHSSTSTIGIMLLMLMFSEILIPSRCSLRF
jgi:hypothetical protein